MWRSALVLVAVFTAACGTTPPAAAPAPASSSVAPDIPAVPGIEADAVRPGTHVNAVGAFTPEMAELAPGLLDRAFVVVDDIATAAAEAGDLIQAGRVPDTTLRALLAGTSPRVESPRTDRGCA